MPLKNDPDKEWIGWLVHDAVEHHHGFLDALFERFDEHAIPKASIKTGTLKMWWYDSKYVDVTSTLDKSSMCTIHVAPYGRSLWVGRAAERRRAFSVNYHIDMAASAFLTMIDRCIESAVYSIAPGGIQTVSSATPHGDRALHG